MSKPIFYILDLDGTLVKSYFNTRPNIYMLNSHDSRLIRFGPEYNESTHWTIIRPGTYELLSLLDRNKIPYCIWSLGSPPYVRAICKVLRARPRWVRSRSESLPVPGGVRKCVSLLDRRYNYVVVDDDTEVWRREMGGSYFDVKVWNPSLPETDTYLYSVADRVEASHRITGRYY